MRLPILIFLSFLAASDLFSQDKPDLHKFTPKRFIDKVEIIAGPSLLFSHGSDYQTQTKTLKYGYVLGLALSHRFNDRFELTFNSLYENKAVASKQTYLNDSSFSASTEVNFKINYFTISTAPSFSITKDRRLFLFLGPYYSLILNTGGYYSGYMNKSGYNKSYAFWVPSKLSHIPNDAGCTFGIRYALSVNKVKVSFLINMNYGLVKINDWNETSIKNMGLNFLIKVVLRN